MWDDGSANPEPCLDKFDLVTKVRHVPALTLGRQVLLKLQEEPCTQTLRACILQCFCVRYCVCNVDIARATGTSSLNWLFMAVFGCSGKLLAPAPAAWHSSPACMVPPRTWIRPALCHMCAACRSSLASHLQHATDTAGIASSKQLHNHRQAEMQH